MPIAMTSRFRLRARPRSPGVVGWRFVLALAGLLLVASHGPGAAQTALERAKALNAQAMALYDAGNSGDAVPHARSALELREKELPAGHRDIAQSTNFLGVLLQALGRLNEAEGLFRRALDLREKALPAGHPDIALSLGSLGQLYRTKGRLAEAEPLLVRALEIREKALADGHTDIAASLNNLALLRQSQRRLGEAGTLLDRALAMRERAPAPDSPLFVTLMNNLALVRQAQGRLDEAAELFQRSIAIGEKAYPSGHPATTRSLGNFGMLHAERENWTGAYGQLVRATNAIVSRLLDVGERSPSTHEQGEGSEATRWSSLFGAAVKVASRVADGGGIRRNDLMSDAFKRVQWAMDSEAAASLAQMASRHARGKAGPARLLRERQDLAAEWRARDRELVASISRPAAERDGAGEQVLRVRLEAIAARMTELDARLAAEFPDFASLGRPTALTTSDVSRQLRDDEALVLLLATRAAGRMPDELFVFAIARTGTRWVRIRADRSRLSRDVAALRCGLDASRWRGDGEKRCRDLLRTTFSAEDARAGKPLPFDAARAHALYQLLFGRIREIIGERHLLVVPTGPLVQLPFHVLTTEPATGPPSRDTAWLARRHAITVLPSVPALAALRRMARRSAGTRPVIGFANPLLDGPDQSHAARAAEARAAVSCPDLMARPRTAAAARQRAPVALEIARRGIADVTQIRAQAPLPETATEVCAVARDLGARSVDVRLGRHATEREVKAMSASGELARFRVVHFATHATVTGELDGVGEPGLILTPPAAASEDDDGYLAASEVAGLRLDADWVILSACNTAAGDAQGSGMLSGLARAFFYAGARALLVSHWEVDSEAAVKLVTQTVGAIARDDTVGRAEALRRAMLAIIDAGPPEHAHPAYWAPFVVVGEGGAPARR